MNKKTYIQPKSGLEIDLNTDNIMLEMRALSQASTYEQLTKERDAFDEQEASEEEKMKDPSTWSLW